MKKLLLFCILVSFKSHATPEVGLINSTKSKRIIFGNYLEAKMNKQSKLKPLKFTDFPKQVRDLYPDFSKDLPQGYLADFNQDGKKDLVFISKYNNVFGKAKNTVVYAAISTSTNRYKIHKVYKFKALNIGSTKLSKHKKDHKTDILDYLSDPEPGKLTNKPVVIENFLGKSIRFKYSKRKFIEVDEKGQRVL